MSLKYVKKVKNKNYMCDKLRNGKMGKIECNCSYSIWANTEKGQTD